MTLFFFSCLYYLWLFLASSALLSKKFYNNFESSHFRDFTRHNLSPLSDKWNASGSLWKMRQCGSVTSSQQSAHLSYAGLASLPVAELHQRWHCSWFTRPREPRRRAGQGQPKEGEPPEQSDGQLSESAQPAGGHASEERAFCSRRRQEQLPHSHRWLLFVSVWELLIISTNIIFYQDNAPIVTSTVQ